MQVPETAGVMILSSAVLFPRAMLPLFIFEPRYRTMLAESLDTHRMFCVAMQKPSDSRETPLPVAGVGMIRAAVKNPNGTSNLVLQGVARVRLGKAVRYKPYRVHQIEEIEPADADSVVAEALRHRLIELVETRLAEGVPTSAELLRQIARSGGDPDDPTRSAVRALGYIGDAGHLADLVTLLFIDNPVVRQAILQAVDVPERLRLLIRLLETDPEDPGA